MLEQRLAELVGQDLDTTQRYSELVAALRGISRVVTDDASLVPSDGSSISSTTYNLDVTTGDVLLDGVFGTIAAESDTDILLEATATDLDGNAPSALADGDEVVVVLCAILVSGVPTLAYVFGASAASSPATPTAAQCRRALAARGISGHTESGCGIVLGTSTLARSGSSVSGTHATASTDSIKAARLAGALV